MSNCVLLCLINVLFVLHWPIFLHSVPLLSHYVPIYVSSNVPLCQFCLFIFNIPSNQCPFCPTLSHSVPLLSHHVPKIVPFLQLSDDCRTLNGEAVMASLSGHEEFYDGCMVRCPINAPLMSH